MKKVVIYLLSIVFFCISATAQQKRDTVGFNGKQSKSKIKLKEELNLSKKQSRDIRTVNQRYKQELETVKADTSLSKEQQQQKRREIIRERQQKTDSLLTPEQRKKAREMLKERRKSTGE
jgi:Spy/CpxP family protein refolding chaperone